jgi:hypothetical protein
MKKVLIALGVIAGVVALVVAIAKKVEVKVWKVEESDEDEDAEQPVSEHGAPRPAGIRLGVRSETGLDVLGRIDEYLKNPGAWTHRGRPQRHDGTGTV